MNLAKLFAVSLLFLLVMASVSLSAVALTGELSIGAGGDYTTFTSAINALNTNGVGAGGVIFNVASGSVFSENLPAITATGTVENQIIFRKSGTNANPQVRPSGTAGTTDAGLIVHGGDYITFDGIDVNSSAVTTVEYGYLIRNASATNGAQHITVKNVNITMNTSVFMTLGLYCSAIMQSSSTVGGGVTATAASGTNSYNKYYNLNLQNVVSGIVLYGSSQEFRDTGCEIGTTDNSIRNVISNVGSTSIASESRGIYLFRTDSYKISNTDISGVQGMGVTDIIGIRALGHSGTNYINNNKISNINNSYDSSSSSAMGMHLESELLYTETVVYLYNNVVMNVRSSRSSVGEFYGLIGMRLGRGGDQTNEIFNVYNNTISIGYGISPRCSSVGLAIMAWIGDYNIMNNIIANYASPNQSVNPQSNHYGVYCYTRNLADGVTDYNVYYTPNGFIGIADGWQHSTIDGWQGLIMFGEEDHSIYTNPHFVNPDNDVHASAGRMMNLADYTYPAYLTYDMDYQPRDSGTYAGADVFVAFDDSSTITAPVTQVPTGYISSVMNTIATAKDVFRFTLTDLGPDGQGTKVKTIKIMNANPVNGASWLVYLNGAFLKVNDTPVVVSNTTITATYISFTIPEGNLVVPENSSIEVSLAVYLKTVGITEGLKLQFKIPAAHECDTYSWNTRFALPIAADVISNEISLEVIGTTYVISNVPNGAVINTGFRLTITAKDVYGNIDTNIVDTVTLSLHTGNGTLTSYIYSLTQPLYQGTYDWTGLRYDMYETIKIKANGSLPEAVTGNIIIAPFAQVPWALAPGQTTIPAHYPFVSNLAWGRTVSLYTSSEITVYGNITALSWNVSVGGGNNIPCKIYLKQIYGNIYNNQTWEEMKSSATEVYSGTLNFTTTGWKKVTLTTPFNYSNGSLLVLVEANSGINANSYTAPRFVHSSTYQPNQIESSGSGSPSSPLSLNANNYRADVRIHFNSAGMYESSTTTQASTASIAANSQNQQIIRTEITTTGNQSTVQVNSLTFNTMGSSAPGYITTAKVYYTGTSTSFATTTQYGTTVTDLGSKGSFTVSQNMNLPEGTSYFWLCYDIGANPPIGTTFDAQCTSVRVGNANFTPTITDPAGNRAVAGKKVGSVDVYTISQGNTSTGASNLAILELNIYVYEASDAESYNSLPLNSISIRSKNTNDTDVSAAKLFVGLNLTSQLGSNQTFVSGNALFNSLNYELPVGNNTIRLYYDVSGAAGVGNILDAKVLANAINIAGNTYPATDQDPNGQYIIQNYNYGGGFAEQGGYYFANTLADPAPSKPAFNWIDISTTGTNAYPDMSSDDGAAPNNSVGYDIGFSFPYFGQSYTKFWIGADGAIYFSRPSFPPAMGINPNVIGLFMGSFHPANPDYPKTILFQNVGNTMVITYLKCQPATGNTPQTYFTGQIILYPTGKIKLQYLEKGTQTVLNNGMAVIANQNLSAYYLYNISGQYGPIFGDNPIAVAFGQNAHMLSDTAADNDLPVPASGTPTINFPNTGATVQFITSTASTNLTAIRVDTNPGGTLPEGILRLANRHWTINSTATTGLGTYNLTLNLSGIPNLPADTEFYLVKREHVNSPWTNLGLPSSYNSAQRLATWTLINGFSDFGIGYETNETLPVELSSFSAVSTTLNSVTLQWTTQSESNLSGYYVYRSSDDSVANAINLNRFVVATNSSSPHQYIYTDEELGETGTYYYWLQSMEMDGTSHIFGSVTVTLLGGGTEPPPVIPLFNSFDAVYPNPFNPDTTIKYSLKEVSSGSLSIYNQRGQLVRDFQITNAPAGPNSIYWNGMDRQGRYVSSGLYLFILRVGSESFNRKATIVK